MELDVKLKRLYKDEKVNILATYQVIDGETYYCLADILEQLHLKENCQISKEISPLSISGKIVWGFRFDTLNLIETMFIDENSALNIIKTQVCR